MHLSAPVAVKCASRCLPPRCTNGEKANLTSVVECRSDRAGGPSHLTRPPGLQSQRVFTASGASALAGSASATLVDNAISLRKRSFRSLLMRIGSSADQEATRPQKVSRQQLARADVIYASPRTTQKFSSSALPGSPGNAASPPPRPLRSIRALAVAKICVFFKSGAIGQTPRVVRPGPKRLTQRHAALTHRGSVASPSEMQAGLPAFLPLPMLST